MAQIAYSVLRSQGANVKLSDFIVEWGSSKEEVLSNDEIKRRVLSSCLFKTS
jgi:hypothetical protein